MKNHVLHNVQQTVCLTSLLLFFVFFSCTASRTVSAISYFNFSPATPSDKRSFVQLKDSSLIYGKKARYGGEALISKKVVRIDGKPYPFENVVGMQDQGHYYIKIGDDQFAKRLIRGRITVYRRYVTYSNGAGYTQTFLQKDGGAITEASLDNLEAMMRDCKKAYDMLNISLDELHKIVRKQPYYVQEAIETYNNCGEWK